jgi:hypothetical protein
MCIDYPHPHMFNYARSLTPVDAATSILRYKKARNVHYKNNFIGMDVSLTDMSIQDYNSLGFNTRSLTQDMLQGQFTITTESLIPIMSHSDNFTWAKYGHHIQFRGELTTAKCQLTIECSPSLNSMHSETLIAFLQTDLEAYASNVLDKSSDVKIEMFLKKLFLPMKGV